MSEYSTIKSLRQRFKSIEEALVDDQVFADDDVEGDIYESIPSVDLEGRTLEVNPNHVGSIQ